MTYKTLMVHLELNGDNEGLLKVTGDLAGRFNAHVIGIAACQPIPPIYEQEPLNGDIIAMDRAEISKELAAVESQFREALAGKAAGLEWRSTVTFASLADFIAEQSRAADLIITGRDIGGALLDNTRRVNIGDLVMRAGKPILIVPQGIDALPMNHVFVGWKESREARRAVADALPLLKKARHVTVLEVAPRGDAREAQTHVTEVAVLLDRHQIAAVPLTIAAPGMEAASLRDALVQGRCDLLVAGIYSHNRLGEWVFGGVSQDLLLDPDFCVLVSH